MSKHSFRILWQYHRNQLWYSVTTHYPEWELKGIGGNLIYDSCSSNNNNNKIETLALLGNNYQMLFYLIFSGWLIWKFQTVEHNNKFSTANLTFLKLHLHICIYCAQIKMTKENTIVKLYENVNNIMKKCVIKIYYFSWSSPRWYMG